MSEDEGINTVSSVEPLRSSMITEDFPRNELEFHERFSSEEACCEYWSKLRWPDGFVCPHCGFKGGWRRSNSDQWICANHPCRKATSLRAGTVLHNSPKPIRAWLMAMLHMSVNKQGISAVRLQRLMGFGSYETALRWLRELRRVMQPLADSEKLGPEVEVDEEGLGGVERGGKGPFVGKTWIIGAVEKRGAGCGRVRLRVLKDNSRKASEICGFVRDTVMEGSLVSTDSLAGYGPLPAYGYKHDPRTTTNGRGGSAGYYLLKMEDGRKKADVHLPRIFKVFNLVKRIVNGCLQGSFSERHLQLYLDEYCFRFNRRYTSTPLGIFQALCGRAIASQCFPYWRSSGREAPDKPTRKANNEWCGFGDDLSVSVYLG